MSLTALPCRSSFFGRAAFLAEPGARFVNHANGFRPNAQPHAQIQIAWDRVEPVDYLKNYIKAWDFPQNGWNTLVINITGSLRLEDCFDALTRFFDTETHPVAQIFCLFPDGRAIRGSHRDRWVNPLCEILSAERVKAQHPYVAEVNIRSTGTWYVQIDVTGEPPPPLGGKIRYASGPFGSPLAFSVGYRPEGAGDALVGPGEIRTAIRPLLLANPDFLRGIPDRDIRLGVGALIAAQQCRKQDLEGRGQRALLRSTLGSRSASVLRRLGAVYNVWHYQQANGLGPYRLPRIEGPKSFGRIVSTLMQEYGFTRPQMAEILGTDTETLISILDTRRTVPYDRIVALLNLFALADPALLVWQGRHPDLVGPIRINDTSHPAIRVTWRPLGREGLFVGLPNLVAAHRRVRDLSGRQLLERAAQTEGSHFLSASALQFIERGTVRIDDRRLAWLCKTLGIAPDRAWLERDAGMILAFVPAVGAGTAVIPTPQHFPYEPPEPMAPPPRLSRTLIRQQAGQPHPISRGTLGYAVRLARSYLGLTSRELCRRSELQPQNLSDIELNLVKPHLLTLSCLSDSRALGIPITELARLADATSYPDTQRPFPVKRFGDPTLPPIYQNEEGDPKRLEEYWRWQQRYRFLPFGARLRLARKDLRRIEARPGLRLTMDEDCRATGIWRRDWIKYEQNRQVPSDERVRILARHYGADEAGWVESAARTRRVLAKRHQRQREAAA